MVRDDGEPLLMDFGLAARLDETEKLTRGRPVHGHAGVHGPGAVARRGGGGQRPVQPGLSAVRAADGRAALRGRFERALPDAAHAAARRRRRGSIGPDLPRDLETICLKCLEKEPARRYPDCQALADDLRRWLEGEPVTARRPGIGERLVRWTRRNPALAGMLAALVVVILGSMTGLTALYVNAEQQRNLAERHRQMAEHEKEGHGRSAGSMKTTCWPPRPKGWEGGRGTDVTLREALDKAAPKIDEAFAGQPEMEANVRYTLGSTYWYLGQFEAAVPSPGQGVCDPSGAVRPGPPRYAYQPRQRGHGALEAG